MITYLTVTGGLHLQFFLILVNNEASCLVKKQQHLMYFQVQTTLKLFVIFDSKRTKTSNNIQTETYVFHAITGCHMRHYITIQSQFHCCILKKHKIYHKHDCINIQDNECWRLPTANLHDVKTSQTSFGKIKWPTYLENEAPLSNPTYTS